MELFRAQKILDGAKLAQPQHKIADYGADVFDAEHDLTDTAPDGWEGQITGFYSLESATCEFNGPNGPEERAYLRPVLHQVHLWEDDGAPMWMDAETYAVWCDAGALDQFDDMLNEQAMEEV